MLHPEKGLEDTFPVLRRDAAPGIDHPDDQLAALLGDGDAHRPARAVIADGIFGQVEDQPVDQRIAAGQHPVALTFQRDALFLRQRHDILEDLLHHRGQLDTVGAGDGAQLAHLQKGLGHLGHALGLLPQKPQKIRRFRQHVGMLRRKQFQLRLHQRKRRPQLMGGVAGKLPLCGKALVQAVQHPVKGTAELLKFRQHLLIQLHFRQVIRLHLLHPCGKGMQRL